MLVSVVVTFALEVISGGQGVRGVPSLFFGIAAGGVVMFSANAFEKRVSSV